ncbi:hypothetical protein Goari_015190 [Gossypium aridum]|uniref:ACB domain-containing protein n=1 Tax=Gossypium aridum TaxID=34290 RepID=A0A7J8XK40_GOSAI|nr:hypothetical protein [Gossypium aridum]
MDLVECSRFLSRKACEVLSVESGYPVVFGVLSPNSAIQRRRRFIDFFWLESGDKILSEQFRTWRMTLCRLLSIKSRILYQIYLCFEEFEEYAEKAKTLPENTTNDDKLSLYGLFKQATVGPVNTSRPGKFNMKEKYKWDAWKAVEGKSKEEAMNDYITKVKQLQEAAAAASS